MMNAKQKISNVAALRIPPHSIEAEQSIIASMLVNEKVWDRVSSVITSDDFYNLSHQVIFKAISRLLMNNALIDIVTVDESLTESGDADTSGGMAYLIELTSNLPSSANVEAYCAIVKNKSILRNLISATNEISELAYNTEGRDAKEILDLSEGKLTGLLEANVNKGTGPVDTVDALTATIDRLEALVAAGKEITGVSSGYPDLDKRTSGFQPSDLIIIAARPSMGKTTFAMNLVENASMKEEKPALVFSMEMPTEQLMMRSLASLSRVDQTKIRTAQLDDDDWARMGSTMGVMKEKNNIYIDDSSSLTPLEVKTRAKMLHKKHGGLSMIMIDYLQLMKVPSLAGNRTLEVAEISRSLKALAKELKVPVIALSQLNRGLENRSDKRPINSDLRESGSIEQDADLIMFIYRDEVYHENSEDKGIAEIIIGKQRNGPLGTTRLTFNGQHSRFDNYAGSISEDDY